jgi:hypothetical protein
MFIGIGSKFHRSRDNQVRTAARAWVQEASHYLSIHINCGARNPVLLSVRVHAGVVLRNSLESED